MPPPASFDLQPILAGMNALREGLAERVLPKIADPALRAEIQNMVTKLAEYQTQVPAEYEELMAANEARLEKSLSAVNAKIANAQQALQAPPPLPEVPAPPPPEPPTPAFPADYGQQLRTELLSRYQVAEATREETSNLDDSVWQMGPGAWQDASDEPAPPAPPPPRRQPGPEDDDSW